MKKFLLTIEAFKKLCLLEDTKKKEERKKRSHIKVFLKEIIFFCF